MEVEIISGLVSRGGARLLGNARDSEEIGVSPIACSLQPAGFVVNRSSRSIKMNHVLAMFQFACVVSI